MSTDPRQTSTGASGSSALKTEKRARASQIAATRLRTPEAPKGSFSDTIEADEPRGGKNTANGAVYASNLQQDSII